MGGPLSDILTLNAPGSDKMKNRNLEQFPLYFLNKTKSVILVVKKCSDQFGEGNKMFLEFNFT